MNKSLSYLNLLKLGVIPLIFFGFYATGQTITKETISVLSGTVCPTSQTNYSVSIPNNFGSCKIKWTVVNGVINGPDNLPTVKVNWNDTPGARAIITVTFSGCASGNPNEGVTSSKDELILSIKNQEWGSYGTSVNIDYCTNARVNLSVPRMFVLGTGGVAQPQLTEVVYFWTVPSGWQELGTHRTGSFGTTSHFIALEPLPNTCSKPGNVTVYGTLVGSGPFCNDAVPSATATIALTGATPTNATVTPQAGYTGGSACNTAPVTFYATTNPVFGCASSYKWEFPASWSWRNPSTNQLMPSPITTTNNSITLIPSGTSADSNPIKSTINFSCGSSITSGNYTPSFANPLISLGSSNAVCFDGTTVTLNNAGGLAVTWSVSGGMNIVSGQGTSVAVIKANSSTTSIAGTINASINCPGISVPIKSVWVGKAMIDGSYDGQLLRFMLPDEDIIPYNLVCNGYYTTCNMSFRGSTSCNWQKISSSPSSLSWSQSGNNLNFYFWAVGQTSSYRATTSNSCGTTTNYYYFKSIDCSGGGGDPCNPSFSVSPNPSSNTVNIVVPNVPPPCESVMSIQQNEKTENKRTIKSVALHNAEGELKRSQEFTGKKESVSLDISDLPKGIYVLKISDGTSTETHRIVKD